MSASRAALAVFAGMGALTPGFSAAQSLQITVQLRETSTCYASVEGREFKLPDEAKSFAQRLKQLRKKWRAASIVGDTDVPYRCIGGVIYIAQSAKFTKVGFPTQPPQ